MPNMTRYFMNQLNLEYYCVQYNTVTEYSDVNVTILGTEINS